MIRRALLVAAISLACACGGGDPQGQPIPEGRCEKDEDCKPDERCAMVATVCLDPPYCGACVTRSP